MVLSRAPYGLTGQARVQRLISSTSSQSAVVLGQIQSGNLGAKWRLCLVPAKKPHTPYVYRKVSNLEEQPKVGSHECVALIREYTNAPPSSTWRQGAAVLGNMSIEKGTAIATFVKGRYPNARTGNHAAFFLRFDPQGFWVMDQWRNNKTKKTISSRLIRVSPKRSASDNAAAYSIIE